MGRPHSGRPKPVTAGGAREVGTKSNGLRQQGIWIPLSRFPLRGKAGAGGFPPRRSTSRRQQNALARVDAPAPPTRGLPPPCASPAGASDGCGSGALEGRSKKFGPDHQIEEKANRRGRLHKRLDTTHQKKIRGVRPLPPAQLVLAVETWDTNGGTSLPIPRSTPGFAPAAADALPVLSRPSADFSPCAYSPPG